MHGAVSALAGRQSSAQTEVSSVNNFSVRLGCTGSVLVATNADVDMLIASLDNVHDVFMVAFFINPITAPGYISGAAGAT